ncbi:MFS transporter [Pontivivens insulae]|uniref:Riboflavin transporter RfnT n=1 Tax=Pontivivens insulae TaxID=1639689 RepID=A0A2R8ABY7_9RHOB|nr:MFS transporter [Pontivivens insulae]RED11081.1 putative MFS family arabinose efflux permease [Pontivivens insulae]SPF29744.1 Riboflavin transporter RfnT [Pontivivens insulae]
MTDLSSPLVDDRRARRNVAVLVAAQGLLGAQMPVAFVLGGLAGQLLAENKLYATLPISMVVIVSMIAAPILSMLMGRIGRQWGFFIGAAGGAIGAALSVQALLTGSFTLLLIGHGLTGIYMAAQGFYRFAATDVASEAFRPKAISYVLAGGLASAIIGPQIVIWFGEALAPIQFAGGYAAIVLVNVVGAFLFFFLDIPKPARTSEDGASGRPMREILAQPRVYTAIICGMVSYALMNLMMTSTPLAVVGCGFTTEDAASVVQFHVLAMFAPSFFTGSLIARYGVERIIAIGLALLLLAGIVALSGVELGQFYAALILLGLGWNFGFIGATAMLTSAHRPEERAKVQGLNDFLVFGMVAVASFASGGLMNGVGADDVLLGWSAVNYAMVPFLLLAGIVLGLYVLRGKAAMA